jgi:hypothetical protein
MMNFFKQHKVALLIVGGLIAVYALVRYYINNSSQSTNSDQAAADQAAAYQAALAAAQGQTVAATGGGAGQSTGSTGVTNVTNQPGTSGSGVPSSSPATQNTHKKNHPGAVTPQPVVSSPATSVNNISQQVSSYQANLTANAKGQNYPAPVATVGGCQVIDPSKGVCAMPGTGQPVDCGYLRGCDSLTGVQHCQFCTPGTPSQPGLPCCTGQESDNYVSQGGSQQWQGGAVVIPSSGWNSPVTLEPGSSLQDPPPATAGTGASPAVGVGISPVSQVPGANVWSTNPAAPTTAGIAVSPPAPSSPPNASGATWGPTPTPVLTKGPLNPIGPATPGPGLGPIVRSPTIIGGRGGTILPIGTLRFQGQAVA